MCTNLKTVHVKTEKPSDLRYRRYGYDTYFVPCGKCDECLKVKRQNIAVNAYRTAVRLPNMIFATFTYNDNALPIAFRYEIDGQIVNDKGICPEGLDDGDYRKKWFSVKHPVKIIDGKRCICCERSTFELGEILGMNVKLHLTPSLNRFDWRMSIKRSRVRYQREFGKSLDFKYMCIGEYGPRTNRPHLHCLFWNLTEKDAAYLFKDWMQNYGFVEYHKVVPRYHNNNGKIEVDDGKFSCANYVSKYLVKGEEYEYIEALNGFCEKPRKCISKDVGFMNDIEPSLENHLFAFDVCRYDPDHFDRLPEDKQIAVLEMMLKRRYYPINGACYSIPNNLKYRLFYVKEKQVDGSVKYRPRSVQTAFTNFVRMRNDEIFEKQLKCSVPDLDSEMVDSVLDGFLARYENSRHSDLSSYKQDYFQTISKSLF